MLTTSSYLEYYLTLLGWVLNNGLFSVLVDTGLFAIPLSVIVLQEWLKARGEGADEGNKGLLSLARIENRLYVAYLVILFCFVPAVGVSVTELKFDKSRSVACGRIAPDPSATGWGKTFESSIDGKSAMMPIWWALIHTLSKGITMASVSSIPCAPDITEMSLELDQTRINDKQLTEELSYFTKDCFGAARYRLSLNNNPLINKEEQHDVNWIGSNFFLTTAGYYDTLHSKTPIKAFPYDLSRDEGLGNVGLGGYPTCKEWWEDANHGLRLRLIGSLDPTLIDRFTDWIKSRSADEVTDAMIRRMVSPEQQKRTLRPSDVFQETGFNSRSESGSAIGNFITNVGLGLGIMGLLPSMVALQTALPMVQAFLIMMVITCLPLILVFGLYSVQTVMNATFGLFSLYFCTFIWELCRWMDSSVKTALYGDVGLMYKIGLSLPTAGINDATVTDQVFTFVLAALFLILPALFFKLMMWAGQNAGAHLGGLLTNGSGRAGEAGAKGGQIVSSAVTSGVARGASGVSGGIRGGK